MIENGNPAGVSQDWRAVKNLLAIRLDSLGDVLMTTPALGALRESLPDCRITLLTSPSGAAVAPYIREVDETIVYEAPWMKASEKRAGSAPDLEMIGRLRDEGFDAAVIFTVYSQNPLPAAMACYLADIPRRLAHCRENPYQLLTDWVIETEPDPISRHEVQRQLDLVASVGCETGDARLRFHVTPADRQRVMQRLSTFDLDPPKPFVIVHPGASAPSRRYPLESFSEVVRSLVNEGMPVVFTGSASEVDLVEQIRRQAMANAASLAGLLSLGELGALIETSALLIANNTGPVHLAAAVGTPVVDLYALTNPQHTPWMVPNITLAYDVPCRFCYKSVCPQRHHDCLRRIEPAWVFAAAKTLFNDEDPEQFYRSVPADRLYRGFPSYQPVSQ